MKKFTKISVKFYENNKICIIRIIFSILWLLEKKNDNTNKENNKTLKNCAYEYFDVSIHRIRIIKFTVLIYPWINTINTVG